MSQLSYKFRFKFGKRFNIISSIISSIAILIFIIYYIIFGGKIKIEAFCFLALYILYSNIFNYYLIISKTIKYNSDYFFIQQKSDDWEKIPIKNITKIKRTFHYFYSIHYKIINDKKKVVFFISPNPSFFKSQGIKEILSYIKK
jgi:hypothetical protein